MHERLARAAHLGLNPFFIRSAVGMVRNADLVHTAWVLIPSSSGLRLEWNGRAPRVRDPNYVLIPSSSGLRLE